MNGLNKIIKDISSDAEMNARQIVEEAEAEAARIRERSEENAAKLEAAAAAEAELEYKRMISRAQSSGEILIKRAVLKEKQNIVCDILAAARKKLLALDDKEYFDALLAMLEKYASGEKGVLILNERDRKRMPSAFKKAAGNKGLTVSNESGQIDGGFVLVYGNIEENCSFTAIMEDERDMLFDAVSGFLF